ncbi:MAG: acyl-ACP--UDP-N-acetylglucosamine O-acyltransferase [candidate division Zixibacteria bacterium]|nr:acyl-ACP--UDP-N-acetylglucosamine O-acyltransferase [candidate division Zixibacteria bacterium]
MIHKTAIVSSKAEIHDSVEVGPFTVIEDNVVVGEGSKIGSHVQLSSGARLGKNVQVYTGAVIGSVPQDLKFEGEDSLANVGDNTIIREYATFNRGTNESGSSDVGMNCLLMAYSHIAHDCKIGNNVILANSVNLAGHIHIDDHAIIGGIVPVHQFVHIGAHVMIGGGFRVPQDVCPYSMVGGYPLKVMGLNIIGLRRRGFSREAIGMLQKVFKRLFFSNLNTKQAVASIRDEIEKTPEVEVVLRFIENSSGRGITK